MADISSLLGAAGIGGVIGKAIVSLELSTAKYQAELKAAQGETAASTGAMGSSMGKFSGFAGTAMLAVGAAVVAGVAVSIKAASDLNEQINKTKEVFEGSAGAVLAWSETTAEGFGISDRAALQAAGSFGQILDAAGLAESATSTMSMSLVELAADLSSFNNIEPDVVLEKLQSGLAGMARHLREVGVFLSAARVETEAYTSGIAEQGEELTDAQKIQARYNIILEDTTKAQGDFARTVGDSLPNQLRVMKAELEETAGAVGEVLLPVVLDFVHLLENLVPLLEKVAQLISYLPIVQMGEDFDSNASAVEKWGNALIDTIPVLGHFIDISEHLGDTMGEQVATMLTHRGLVSQVSTFYREKFATALKGPVSDAVKRVTNQVEDFTLSLEESEEMQADTAAGFKAATQDMLQHARALNSAVKEIAKEDWVNRDYVAFLSEQGPDWLIGFADLNEKAQHRMQDAWEESTKKTAKSNERLENFQATLDKLDRGETKHKVTIQYEYVDFDPTKPGMQPMQGNQGGRG